MKGYTDDDIKQYFSYQQSTGQIVWKDRPHGAHITIGAVAGWLDKNGYHVIGIHNTRIFAHRVAWFLHYGEWPYGQVDHINGIPNDNHIENLRIVTCRQNQQNQKKHRSGRLVGAYFDKRAFTNPWKSKIIINGKQHHIGSFATELEAHTAYMSEYKRMFSEKE
jgi:hypothetical protein